ncbi:MAG: hypothetical protein HY073_02440, partial [Deltaproteobacteria bacterium]|nr:hypothetical protein [Deltaproteobacteria bacterium]
LAVALAECCMTGSKWVGADIETSPPAPLLSKERVAANRRTGEVALLFAETQSRIIVSAKEKDLPALLKIAKVRRCPASVLGKVGGKRLKIADSIDVSVEDLHQIWSTGFERSLCAE